MTNLEPIEEYERRLRAALALRDVQDYRAALDQLRKATQALPDQAQGWLLLGLTHQDLGQPRAARLAFERALELDPEAREVRMALAAQLIEQGHNAEAARQLRPLAEAGDDPEAERAYIRALGRSPVGARRAIPVLQRALARNPGDEDIALQLVHLYGIIGDKAAAQRLLEPIAGRAQSAITLAQLALAYFRLDQPADALAFASAAVETEPNNPVLWSILATVARAAGDDSAALRAAVRATEIGPDSVFSWLALARTYLRLDHRADAALAARHGLHVADKLGASSDELTELRLVLSEATSA